MTSVPNGDFETGDFTHWTVDDFNTFARVEVFGGSYKARLIGGRSTGQLLYTRIKATPGVFELRFSASAPDSIKHNGPPEPLKHAFILFIVTAFDADNRVIQHDFSLSGLNPQKQTITLRGQLLPEAASVEVRFSIPSDPFGNKGPTYLDAVDFIQSSP